MKDVALTGGLLIFLIGFSGSGKSSTGRILARMLRLLFVDTDELIEQRTGRSISRIFADRGEAYFRRMESQVLRATISGVRSGAVVSVGGGAWMDGANRRLIQDSGVTVYLKCSVRELYRRLSAITDRPLLSVTPRRGMTRREARMRRIQNLLEKRKSSYLLADIHYTTTNKTPQAAARELRDIIRKRYGPNQRQAR